VVTLTVEKRSVPAPERGAAVLRAFGLHVIAAALQIFATVAVVQVLPPSVAGVYFKGVVIAYGLASLLRGKYDLFVAQHFIGPSDPNLPARDVVRGLGIRVLARSAIACAILLVVTTDLDVMEPHLRPYLETYLPFVLAVPFTTLAFFLASVLRAINRSVSGTLAATYSINVMVLATANSFSGSQENMLVLLSWAFFAGTVLAAGVGVAATRAAFPEVAPPLKSRVDAAGWREIYASARRNGLTGMTFACLQWGPLCLFALLGTEIDVAHYAVVTRTATVIDFLIPAAILVPHTFLLHSRLSDTMRTAHGKLLVDLCVSVATTTIIVLAVALATPWIVEQFGPSYTQLTVLFALLFATQWFTGVARPAIRHLAVNWNLPVIRRILFSSMLVAVASSLVGIPAYGALGAAISVFAGSLMLNGQAVQAAFAGCGARA
jgi:hypothetical protein